MFFFKDNKNQISLNNFKSPDYCEFEGIHTFFKKVKQLNLGNIGNEKIVIVYECMSCKKFICVEYNVLDRTPVNYDYNFIKPDFPFDEKTTKILKKLSPRFINVYKQASIAEKCNLDEIDKASYRKSIEVLINDFLKSTGIPDKELENKFMSKKIEMLPDNDLFKQSVPQLISWIGNDGSHVYEKHPEFDVEYMKQIIHSFVLCIAVIQTNKECEELVDNLKNKNS